MKSGGNAKREESMKNKTKTPANMKAFKEAMNDRGVKKITVKLK